MRVLITGVSGELGTRIASALSADRRVNALAGLDLTAPNRAVPSLQFTEVEPRDRRRVLAAVRAFEPSAIIHLGVYEPDAWSAPRIARERTSANTLTVLGAAAELAASTESSSDRAPRSTAGRVRPPACRMRPYRPTRRRRSPVPFSR